MKKNCKCGGSKEKYGILLNNASNASHSISSAHHQASLNILKKKGAAAVRTMRLQVEGQKYTPNNLRVLTPERLECRLLPLVIGSRNLGV